MKRIAMLIPYIGNFKNYFDFYLTSVLNNKTIDFHFFTNNSELRRIADSASNLFIHEYNLTSLRELFTKKMGEEVRLDSPYKLCDYKCMYGLFFEDYIKEYDFWGHCDTDLIFGDIREFITEDILSKFDKILSSGHFTLYKNTYDVNVYFKKSETFKGIPSYKQVIIDKKNYSFDEWPGVSRMWNELDGEKMYKKMVYDDIMYLKKHFTSAHKQNEVNKDYFIFEYDHGSLYRVYIDLNSNCICKEPTMYVHFQKRDFSIEQETHIDKNHYLIIPNKFIPYKEPTLKLIKEYGKHYLFYAKYIVLRFNNLKRKIKDLFN